MVEHFYPREQLGQGRQAAGGSPLNIVNVPQAEKPPGMGSVLGSALGQGFGQGLGEGIQSSIKQMMHKKMIDRALGSLPDNASPKDIFSAMSQLPQEYQESFIKTYMPAKEMENKRLAAQQEYNSKRHALASKISMRSGLGSLGTGKGEKPSVEMQPGGGDLRSQQQETISPLDRAIGSKSQDLADKQQELQQKAQALDIMQNGSPEEQQAYLDELDRREAQEEKAYTETKQARLDLEKGHQANIKLGSQLGRMEQLNEKGKMPSSLYAGFLETLHIPKGVLSADAQEFDKISNDLTGNIQQEYGSKILATEFNTFLRRIPTLINSKEGRREIIKNMDLMREAADARYDAYKEIMKGRKTPPRDLEFMIADRAAEKYEAIADKFKNRPLSSEEENEQYRPSETPNTESKKEKSTGNIEAQKSSKQEMAEELAERRAMEGVAGTSLRNVTRSLSRAGETVAGGFGDMAEWAKNIDTKKYPGLKDVQEAGKFFEKILPTSTDVRQVTNYLSGGYTEPRSQGEEKADEIVSTVAAYLSPLDFTKKAKLGWAVIKGIGATTAGAIGKEVAGQATGNDKIASWVGMGSSILASMINPKRAKNFVNGLYNEEKSLRPPAATITNHNVMQDIQRTEAKLSKGIKEVGAKEALDKLNEFKSVASQGVIPLEDLIKEKIKLNQWYYKHDPKERLMLNETKKVIHNAIDEYGATNPTWHKKYAAADRAHEILEKSKKVSRYLNDAATKYAAHGIISGGAGEIGLIVKGEGLFLPAAGAIGAPIGLGLLKATEGLYRGMYNPSFAGLYTRAMMSAINENAQATTKNLGRLINRSKEFDEKEKSKKSKTKK